MIDLKLLESLLDKTLENETPESMLEWLTQQEAKDMECGVVRGSNITYLPMSIHSSKTNQLNTKVTYLPIDIDTYFVTTNDIFNTVA